MEKLPDLTTLTSDQKDALIIALHELVNQLRQELAGLKDQVVKNSQNSSKPPQLTAYQSQNPKALESPPTKIQAGKKVIKVIILKPSASPTSLNITA